MLEFFTTYYIRPIIEHTGYNPINTFTYALLAIGFLYFLYRYIEKRKIEIGNYFWKGVIGWTLWAATTRVITDSVDSGALVGEISKLSLRSGAITQTINWIYTFVLNSHAYDYGFLTTSPGIYIVTAILFFSALIVEKKIRIKLFCAKIGIIFAGVNFLFLAPMIKHLSYALAAISIAIVVVILIRYMLNWKEILRLVPVFSQSLDGAATWISIDWFSKVNASGYVEQHVFSRGIGEATFLGFGLFFLLKTIFSVIAVKFIWKEENQRLKIIALVAIIIMGLAPGLRDILRMSIGT